MTARIAVALAVLLICGLLAATLVRMAPGFGMDERMLDVRLGSGSLQAIERQGAEHSNILRYYWNYLRQLSRGDFGISLSSGRPVREMLSERLALSLRSALAGLGLAWMLALVAVAVLELRHRGQRGPRLAPGRGVLVHSGGFGGAGLRLHRCYARGGDRGNRVSRVFRYVRDVVRQAGAAPHVLTAHALGLQPPAHPGVPRGAPVLPELLALAGISVSMAWARWFRWRRCATRRVSGNWSGRRRWHATCRCWSM